MSGQDAGSDVLALVTRVRPRSPVVLARIDGLASVEAVLTDGALRLRAANLAAVPLGMAVRLEGPAPAPARDGRGELAPGGASDPIAIAADEHVTLALVARGSSVAVLTVSAWMGEPGEGGPVLLAQSVSSRL